MQKQIWNCTGAKKKILSLINMDTIKRTKTMMAGIQFLQNCIKKTGLFFLTADFMQM